MNSPMTDYHLLKHYELQHARLVNEAQRAWLKAEMLTAARRQKQDSSAKPTPIIQRIRVLWAALSAPDKVATLQERDRSGLGTSTSS